MGSIDYPYEPSAALVSLQAESVEGRDYTILFVDDEPTFVEVLARLYEDRYRVLTATSVATARDLLLANDVHAIVSDHAMPKETGIDLLAWAVEHAPMATRVLFTAFEEPALADAVNLAHIRYFVKKPYRREVFDRLVQFAVAYSVLMRKFTNAPTAATRAGVD